MGFLGKKGLKSSDFKDFCFKFPDLDKRSQHVKIYEDSFFSKLFSLILTCSQIWLSPLADDETTCLTKFGGGGRGGPGRGERHEETPKQKQYCFSKNLK